MAYTVANVGARTVHSFADIKADMPANGVGTSALAPCSVLIAGGTAATVVIEVTFDTPAVISAGNATWTSVDSETVTADLGAKVDMWVAPTAIKLTTTTDSIAGWVLT